MPLQYTYQPPQGHKEAKAYKGPNKWETTLLGAPCSDPICFLAGCCLPCCTAYDQRKKLLLNDISRYICCAGMWGPECTAKCTSCTKGKEHCCMCVEMICCLSCAVSGNRYMIASHYSLETDCYDVYLMYLACILSCIAMIIGSKELENIADLVYHIVMGCLLAQHNHQMTKKGYPNGFHGTLPPGSSSML